MFLLKRVPNVTLLKFPGFLRRIDYAQHLQNGAGLVLVVTAVVNIIYFLPHFSENIRFLDRERVHDHFNLAQCVQLRLFFNGELRWES